MKQLWAPWRMEFLLGGKPTAGCIFCKFPAEAPKEKRDKENLILYRSEHCYVIMNRYPYNNGHLMAIPFAHVQEIEKLPAAVSADLIATVQQTTVALKKVFKPDGFNIGINLGHAAGAGIPGHLHFHIVPRWIGDTNFMPILNNTKVLNEHLADTYQRLVDAF